MYFAASPHCLCFLFRFMWIIFRGRRRWNDPTTHKKAKIREKTEKIKIMSFFCILILHACSVHTYTLCIWSNLFYPFNVHSLALLVLFKMNRHLHVDIVRCWLLLLLMYIYINVVFAYLYVHNSCLFFTIFVVLVFTCLFLTLRATSNQSHTACLCSHWFISC